MVGALVVSAAAEPVRADRTEELRARAEAGDGDAQYDLAFLYDNGYGVKQDYAV